ncbi:MAG TPA: hypothetical protein ENI23_06920, partial [bacterium]|nr:hypothetical protein [bacterium]
VGELCPSCSSLDSKKNKGLLEKRKGRFGLFLGCSMFPDCKYSCRMGKLEEQANKLLGRKIRRGKRK